MRKTFRRSILLALAVVLLLTPTFVSARTLDEIISSGVIRVGVNPNYPPAALYDDKNQLDGFDVDIAKKIAQMLGVRLELVVVGPNDRIPFVTSGKIDFSMGFLTRTVERAKLIDFTVPLHTEALGVLTTADKPFKKWQDLNSERVRLVEVRGTTGVTFIKENLPKAKVLLLDNHPDVVRAVAQARGDAVIDIIDFMGKFIDKYPNVKWKILKEPCGEVDYCGLGVAKGNETLRSWLNVVLFDLHNTGFVEKTWKKWFSIGMSFGVQPTPYF